MTVSPPIHHPVQRPPSAHFRAFALGPGGGRPPTEPAALAVKTALAWAMSITVSFTAFLFTLIYFSRVFIMTKFNELSILSAFLRDLSDITNQPEVWRSTYPPTHVLLENATASQRPTAIVIVVELRPALIIVSTLESEISDRYLAIGSKTWPPGMNSEVKRQVAARMEALLIAYGVEGYPLKSKPIRALESRSRATRAQHIIPQLAKPALTG